MSEAYYLQAPGNKGLGNKQLDNELFDRALQFYKNNIWAVTMKNF